MNKFNFQTLFFIAIAIVFTLSSCKKDSSLKDSDIPTTYNFENVNYSGQTARLAMMAEITTYMKTANVSGTVVTAAVLKDMFANENNPFTDAALNADSKDIESKTFAADVAKIKDYMDKLAALSGNTTVASAGVAGIATSGTSSYLVNENGVEYRELIEKSLMGALSYYQIAAVYTSADKIGDAVDNETVIAGEGTAMEHHWDEAFGYIGANSTFDETTYSFHAKYASKGEAAGLNTRTNLFKAFLAGRAAISAKDMDRKNIEAANVRKYMEEVIVTTAISYLNGSKANITDYAVACHQLSEAYGLISSLKYNGEKKVSDADISLLKSYLENTSGEPDFANITVAKINMAIDKLSTIYGLDAVKNSL